MQPLVQELLGPYTDLFDDKFFKSGFLIPILKRVKCVLEKLASSAPEALQERAKHQAELCIPVVKEFVARGEEQVMRILDAERRSISRLLAPYVQTQMIPGYEEAVGINGNGALTRSMVCAAATSTRSLWALTFS